MNPRNPRRRRSRGLRLLLHVCDSLFPTGGYAHSEGLEAAVADGLVRTAGDLDVWLEATVTETLGRCEAPAVFRTVSAVAGDDWDEIGRVDAEVWALRPASASRAASRSMGRRLLRTWAAAYPDDAPAVSAALEALPRGTLPPAFGLVCARIGTTATEAVEAFAYTRLAATVSAAMRLLPIGQHEAHARLAAALTRVPHLAATSAQHGAGGLAVFAPGLDIAAMRHPYVRSRLFLS